MTTLAVTAGTITIPDDIPWLDEFAWSAMNEQRSVTLGGALIIEKQAQIKGRPITLSGSINIGWIDRATMEALYAAEVSQGDTPFNLTLPDGRVFVVLFDSSAGAAVVGHTVFDTAPPPRTSDERAAIQYFVVIKLIEVA